MRRSRSPSAPSHYRALGHHGNGAKSDSIALIRSFNVENNPTRPMRPSPLTASTIRDMPLDLVDRIRSFPLFQSASEEFLVAIGNHLKPQVHAPNDHIITEGDDAKAMYWLVRGVVAVTSRDGEAVYAELKAGAFFGEIGVLMDMPRTATIVARTKCLLLVLKKEDLQTVMPKFPEMEKAIRQEAEERLSVLKKKRLERGARLKSAKSDAAARATAPGEVSTGETGAIKDGTVVKSKKRKSPSPSVIEDPALGSALGSGFVNIRKTLKELPLFSNLPPDVLHFLGLSVQPKTYPPFTDIVREGSPGHEIFFIVRGEAEVIHQQQPKTDREAESLTRSIQKRPRLKAGQYFGEVASLGLSRGRTATVRSITTVECLMIPGETLDELWSRCSPDIKSQVEQTAWHRYNYRDEDVDMADVDPRRKASKSDPPTPKLARLSIPDVGFTTPFKPLSASPRDASEVMEPKDPDPFLSVDMENLRNRRRHSVAPPTAPTTPTTPTETAPTTPAKQNGTRTHLPEQPSPMSVTAPEPELFDMPAKRAKTLSHRPHSLRPNTITDNILVHIFQYADIGELLRLRRVNSHWKHLLTTSPKLCRYVDLSYYNRKVTDQVIIEVLAPFIGTRALVIDLNNCFHITDEGFSVLWKTCGKNVQRWRMRSLWDVSANQILEMSENAKGLREVDWSNCRKVGDNLLGRVVGWVVPEPPPVSNSKVVIASSGRKAKEKAAQQPAPNMPPPGTVIGCPKLNTLNLSYCKHITDRSMGHLAAHASNRLESLSLTRCTSITDAGFQAWAQFKFEKLTHLCLADCTYLSDNAIVALVNAAKNLTHLDLSFCCALSDTATEVVALGLPRLRELRLAFCGSAVSDASLESVALHLNELEGLSVRGCVRVTGKGLEYILRGCTRLNEWSTWNGKAFSRSIWNYEAQDERSSRGKPHDNRNNSHLSNHENTTANLDTSETDNILDYRAAKPGTAMSFTLSIQQGPARIAQQRLLPALTKSALRTPMSMRSFHQLKTPKSSGAFFTSRLGSATTRHGFARSYYQETTSQSQASSATSGTGLRKLLVGGAIFGGTLVAINAVFNRETREDGGMPLFEREYLNNTFLHTGLGVGIIGLTARQMVQTGFVYRLMVTNPWVVGLGGLALSFATMIGTRSISPDNYIPKYALWTAFNATQAAFVAPLLAFVPVPLLARAGLYTVAMMGSLSIVGATAKQEKYLYIGGPLLAGAAIVAASGFAPLLIPATAVRTLAFTESIWLYGGLAVFGGFTLYDVQKVLHHARLAQAGVIKRDPVNESISLELDFLNIFIRFVQILSMNQNRRK
ncbi:hypothetical protein M419DRAFT_139914 [Trichoderma reesei RUT C-30]|uniref:Cyclic nucleotide-binding domain-containing protein n=1 Tax=Hypocrea jecorina (strain ATCC 56765 / BCRC 32924 / NRRL 11460 / Rut C-30) TaxID=1344414 RepID=A0A024SLF4_HYPJR|nr:hypothetical protein M419DRAFT_139914 [Trichoderma reesei RUT C-30]